MFGSGAMTNSISDLGESEVTLIIGSNTTETHPVISMEIIKAVKRGKKKLIVVDPRRIMMADFAEVVLALRPGTNVAVLNGMMNWIIKRGLEDRDYITQKTEGFEELKRTVKKYTPEYVEEISGVPSSALKKAAELFGRAERANILFAMGITQHVSGTDNVRAVADLALLTGNLGKPGTGVNPLRGQNNVQGACDMGALPNVYSGYQNVEAEENRHKMESAWGVSLPPKNGLTAVEMVNEADKGKIKAMYIMGENPMLSDPDLGHTKEALEKLDFLVVQDIFLTETAQIADVVLPSFCFAEKDGTFTNTSRRVQRVRKAVDGPGGAKDDWRIICALADAMGRSWKYEDISDVTREIASVTPSYGGILLERLDDGGLQWPCPTVDHPGTPVLHVGGCIRGKGKFIPVEYREPAEKPDRKYPMTLTTGRILTHYHTGSMTRRCKPLNQLVSQAEAEINPQDAKKFEISDGDNVRLVSRRGSIEAAARVTPRIKPGVVFMPFHFAEAAANVLTGTALDPVCKIPEFKVSAIRLEKVK